MWKDKAIITPKFINSRMFIAIGFHFPSLSDAQDIKYFVEMHGSQCRDLVRVFYYNFKYKDGVAFNKVKGVDIILDNDIWENVTNYTISFTYMIPQKMMFYFYILGPRVHYRIFGQI